MNTLSYKSDSKYYFSVNFQNIGVHNFIVDTGASCSAINYKAVLNLVLAGIVVEYIENASRVFWAVDNVEITGCLCRIKDATIYGSQGEIKIPYLYFYVLIDTDETSERTDAAEGLMGVCLLDKCDFEHRKDGVFIICDFDKDAYNQYYQKLIENKKMKEVTIENIGAVFANT